MDLALNGKVAVVTGAARGIGLATAKLLASEGVFVVAGDITSPWPPREATEKTHPAGGLVMARLDVTRIDSVTTAFEYVRGRFGHLDILVNNAGIVRDSQLSTMSLDDWEEVMAVHLRGAFHCTQAALTLMLDRSYGKIINISSRAALGANRQSNYSTAKAGLQGFTRALAIELGPMGINVNAVAPGHIETEMTREIARLANIPYDELSKDALAANAVKRVGTPNDVANVVTFLASDVASYITGQTIYVAGRPTV